MEDVRYRRIFWIAIGVLAPVVAILFFFRRDPDYIIVQSRDQQFELWIPSDVMPDSIDVDEILIESRNPSESSYQINEGSVLAIYEVKPEGLRFDRPVLLKLKSVTGGNTIPMLWQNVSGELFAIQNVDVYMNTLLDEMETEASIDRLGTIILTRSMFDIVYDRPTDPTIDGVISVIATVRNISDKRVLLSGDGTVAEYSIVAPWTLEGSFETTHVVRPKQVLGTPIATQISEYTFSSAETFTCIRHGLLGSKILYHATINWPGERLTYENKEPVRTVEAPGKYSATIDPGPFFCTGSLNYRIPYIEELFKLFYFKKNQVFVDRMITKVQEDGSTVELLLRVVDLKGLPIEGATIIYQIIDPEKYILFKQLTTDEDGKAYATFNNLELGEYVIELDRVSGEQIQYVPERNIRESVSFEVINLE